MTQKFIYVLQTLIRHSNNLYIRVFL